MKVNVEIDCTPLEARQFIGLSDMVPIVRSDGAAAPFFLVSRVAGNFLNVRDSRLTNGPRQQPRRSELQGQAVPRSGVKSPISARRYS
jgi:hypothetical protein